MNGLLHKMYTVENVGEEVLTTVIPDGFGYNENMELVCVNKDVAVLPVDDDDNMTQPSNLISNTMTGWLNSSVTDY